jgi:hypothetical protein
VTTIAQGHGGGCIRLRFDGRANPLVEPGAGRNSHATVFDQRCNVVSAAMFQITVFGPKEVLKPVGRIAVRLVKCPAPPAFSSQLGCEKANQPIGKTHCQPIVRLTCTAIGKLPDYCRGRSGIFNFPMAVRPA